MYESNENRGQCQVKDAQRELMEMQKKLNDVEISKASLEATLEKETSTRSRLVSQVSALRKVTSYVHIRWIHIALESYIEEENFWIKNQLESIIICLIMSMTFYMKIAL